MVDEMGDSKVAWWVDAMAVKTGVTWVADLVA